MADSDANLAKEGNPIPAVDPVALKRMWNLKTPWTTEALQEACGPGGVTFALSRRHQMIWTLTRTHFKLVTPWQHGEELDDAVFRLAATFPVRELKHKSYMIPGDERFGFDPNAFVQRLIEETGIPHVWEPIPTQIPEGLREGSFLTSVSADPDRQARNAATQLLRTIWERCSVVGPLAEKNAEVAATLFTDFVIDNIDLLRQVEDSFKNREGLGGLDVLMELERKAQEWRPWDQ